MREIWKRPSHAQAMLRPCSGHAQDALMSFMPMLNGQAKICGGGVEFAPQFIQFITGSFNLPLGGARVLGFAHFPGFGGLLEALVGALKQPMLFHRNSAL